MEIPSSIRARLRERVRDAVDEERAEARERAEREDRRGRLRPQAERVMAFVRALVRSGADARRLREVAGHIERGTIWREMERALAAD